MALIIISHPPGEAGIISSRIKRVGILGATGAVGLEGIEALIGHPWFEIGPLSASERSAGKTLREACRLDTSHLPQEIARRQVREVAPGGDMEAVFSALPSAEARKVEPELARQVPVMSTASAFRYEKDVPILITEVNPEHVELLRVQQKERGGRGGLQPQPHFTPEGPGG